MTPRQATPEQRLARLCAAEAAGRQLDLLPFWGHKPTRSGAIGTGCLSQWWPVVFTVEGVSYPSAEHWMMAEKVRGFDEHRWAAARYDIVVAGNLAKFGQHRDLRDFLLATGRKVLVEASPYDRIWGIGMAATNPDAACPARWRGPNLLGFALMEVRERL
jgi:predicted NAD-dependent protein-ADP-ribosyltransferase YbiA (DUF1768 family)